jgi:hypothetical protein
MFVHLKRYARVYHRSRRVYGNVIAPGPSAGTVMFAASDSTITPVPRSAIRTLRWYERLLNR